MHVRKFEADTLDEALRNIKRELGPDAIILKTITNKGLRSALSKKKKIEITAAISQKSYGKKIRVDKVMDEKQKDNFYTNKASHISNMIDEYSQNVPQNNYGDIAKGRPANINRNKKTPSKLDNFLKEAEYVRPASTQEQQSINESSEKTEKNLLNYQDRKELMEQKNKIEELSTRLLELSKTIDRMEKKTPVGISHLRSLLGSFSIDPSYIKSLINKTICDLSVDELQQQETVLEFAMEEMMKDIQTGMPLFSTSKNPVISVLLSEAETGQTSTMLKLGALKKDTVLIQNTDQPNLVKKFTEQIFGMKVHRASNIPGIITRCRKSVEKGQSVILDYKKFATQTDDVKRFVEGLKRSFADVEILICLSAIHSELYNRKMVAAYGKIADGIVVNNLDICLDFGSLFNIACKYNELPFKFFGTGETIPDDMEAATAERILANIFRLK